MNNKTILDKCPYGALVNNHLTKKELQVLNNLGVKTTNMVMNERFLKSVYIGIENGIQTQKQLKKKINKIKLEILKDKMIYVVSIMLTILTGIIVLPIVLVLYPFVSGTTFVKLFSKTFDIVFGLKEKMIKMNNEKSLLSLNNFIGILGYIFISALCISLFISMLFVIGCGYRKYVLEYNKKYLCKDSDKLKCKTK